MVFQRRTAAPRDDTGSTSDNCCGSDASKENIPADCPCLFHLKMNAQKLLIVGLNPDFGLTFPVFALA